MYTAAFQFIDMDKEKHKERPAAQHIEWHELDKRKFYIIGPSLFFFVRIVVYPPVLIKTRLQLQKNKSLYNGTFDAAKKIFRSEGVRGFYKGFLTSTASLLSGQVYVTSYEIIRAKTTGHNNFVRGLIAGGCASIAAQTITVPVDIISQKQMVQGQNESPQERLLNKITRSEMSSEKQKELRGKLKGPFDIVKNIWKESGPKGFYRGYVASLMTYAPSSSIWWASYGMFTSIITDLVVDDTPKVFIQAVSGPLAGVVAAVLTNPLDIIRTRLQVI